MARKAELKSILSLDNLKFVRTIRHSIQLVKDMGRQFAKAPIQSTLVAGMLTARKSVQLTGRGVELMGATAVRAMKGLTIGAGIAAGGILLVAKASVDAAARLEQHQVAFSVLLGSMDKAKDRMKELVQFANKTPFQLDEVTNASRILEVFTHGLLSTGKGLTLVGDIAAGTNSELQETAVNVGRLFDDLRSGRPSGRAMFSLQQQGAISGSKRGMIEGLSAAGLNTEAWALARKELMRFSGMMDKQSKTWMGMMSNFKDAIENSLRAFGGPIIQAFLPALALAQKTVFGMSPKIEEAGRVFADSMKTAMEFLVGGFSNPTELVAPIIGMLKAGMLEVGNVFIAAMRAGVTVITTGVAGEGFFSGLLDEFEGLSKIIGGQLMDAFKKPVAFLIASLEYIKDYGTSFSKNISSATKMESSGTPGGMMTNIAKALWHSAVPEKGGITKRMDDLMKSGDVGGLASGTIEEGKTQMADGAKKLFGTVGKALSSFVVEDVLGASSEYQKAKDRIKRVAVIGNRTIAAGLRDAGPAMVMNNWDAWRSRVHQMGTPTGGLFAAGLRTGGLLGAHFGPAARTTSLLPLAERMKFENETVAGQMSAGVRHARLSHIVGAFGAIRRGDRERMQESQREKLREKEGLDKTNSILIAIQQRFDQLVN